MLSHLCCVITIFNEYEYGLKVPKERRRLLAKTNVVGSTAKAWLWLCEDAIGARS